MAPLLAAILAGGFRVRAAAILCAGCSVLLLAWQPEFVSVRISPYKGLPTALRFPGAVLLERYDSPFARVDTFESPAVRFAPGLSLRWQEPLPRQAGLTVDGGDITAITSVADRQALGFLDELPLALPYLTARPERVLVLNPGGGLSLMMAQRSGAREIVPVESHPEVVRVIRNDWQDFAGDLYGGRTATGLGRSRLRGGEELYDLIDIGLTGVEPYASFGIAEDFRFTVEAVREYLEHLRPAGLLSINLYILPPPRAELRLLAKVSPLSNADIARIEAFAAERWFDLLYVPGRIAGEGLSRGEMAADEYATAVAALLDPQLRAGFVAEYPFAIAPVRDDALFFHYFLKPGRFGDIY